ncbi:MAG: PilZ domain-containing protein [Tsuneonella sp.]
MPLAVKRPPRFASRDPRCAVNLSTGMLLPDDSIAPVTVRNLSDRGFMGECSAEIAEGARLGIDLPGFGIAPAIVRWRQDDEIGCQFRRPIPVERVTQGHQSAFLGPY